MKVEWNPVLGIIDLLDVPVEMVIGHTPRVLVNGLTSLQIIMDREPKEPVTTQRLVDQVSETTQGRRDNYGRPLLNFLRIAALWTLYLRSSAKMLAEKRITPEDVAWMMVLLKVARSTHSWMNDNVLDTMGYADCLDDMNRHMIEMGYYDGVIAIEDMTESEVMVLLEQLNAQ